MEERLERLLLERGGLCAVSEVESFLGTLPPLPSGIRRARSAETGAEWLLLADAGETRQLRIGDAADGLRLELEMVDARVVPVERPHPLSDAPGAYLTAKQRRETSKPVVAGWRIVPTWAVVSGDYCGSRFETVGWALTERARSHFFAAMCGFGLGEAFFRGCPQAVRRRWKRRRRHWSDDRC